MKNDYFIQEKFCPIDEANYICKRLDEDLKLCDIKDLPAGQGIVKTATTDLVLWGHAREYLGRLEETIRHANNFYFGYEIYPTTAFECINYNKYSASNNGEYGWHSDGNREEIYDLKLTAIVNLSTQPYEGGKLELFLGGATHITEFDTPGSFIMFPSFMQHRVTPVTKGTRTTLSMWIKGPKFR